jgi:DNA-binding transcriptional LysR family regulator
MDWRRLKIFKNISTFTSFTHASKELKKSQSTLSRDIISLEQMIGYRVFERNIRGIELTEKGSELLSVIKDFDMKLEKF